MRLFALAVRLGVGMHERRLAHASASVNGVLDPDETVGAHADRRVVGQRIDAVVRCAVERSKGHVHRIAMDLVRHAGERRQLGEAGRHLGRHAVAWTIGWGGGAVGAVAAAAARASHGEGEHECRGRADVHGASGVSSSIAGPGPSSACRNDTTSAVSRSERPSE